MASVRYAAYDSWGDALRFLASRGGPVTILLVILAIIVWKSVQGGWTFGDLVIVALFVSLRGVVEWAIHTYLHHARPLPLLGIRIVTPIHTMHEAHHADPANLDTFLFKGPSVLGVAVVLALAASVVLQDAGRGLAVVLGFMVILLIHEVVHVLCHSRIHPRSRWARRLLARHRAHHFVDETRWLSVSSGLGDRLFGTGDPPRP